ncbi:MAG: competence protein ComEC [Patescibacteria group bacterium]|jgi:competence protein ComEC|nr:competence protein ComEC [Patescibacteria group bacterium]
MKHWLRLIVLYLIVASAVALAWMAYDMPDKKLTVAFLDIGQGDSIFIQSPTGRQVLIDGGIDRDVLAELALVMPFFDRSIDVVIATHPDKDHIGGLPYVFEQYDIDVVLDPGLEADTEGYDFYADMRAQEKDVVYHEARRGQVIDLGGGAYLRILYPDKDMDGAETNSASIATQLIYGETEVMLTGDAPDETENYLVSIDSHLTSDILKAGHHGSKTSTSQVFLDAVDPDYTIISAGKDNSYGHPHQEVVARLVAASTTILTTFEEGTIVFESDGKTLRLMR